MSIDKNYREIDFFIEAIEQEYDLALQSLEKIGFDLEAAKLIGPIRKFYIKTSTFNKKINCCIYPVIFILMPIILLIYAAVFILKNLHLKKGSERCLPKKIYLHKSSDRYVKEVPAHEGKPDAILIVPFHNIPAGQWKEKISLEELTSNLDYYKSLKLTFITVLKIIKNNKRHLILYCLMAPNWYLLYSVLKKQAVDEVWISNHYDRWAILVDHLNVSITIVPHGSLNQTCYRMDGSFIFSYESHYKLRNVKKVFLIDGASEADFKTLLRDVNCHPAFIRISSSLKINRNILSDSKKKLILIIGSPTVMLRLFEILDRINNVYPQEFEIVYRPHPRDFPISRKNFPKTITILSDHDFIPNADFVIDYGSSLKEEIMKISSAKIVGFDVYDPSSIDWIISDIESD